ncbi:MAG: NAD+ synthase [Alphaproteobacteria bacterium]|nr:NAD+ synthase [Alphaproteobacteria bacterium]
MTQALGLSLAQVNPIVGDVSGNLERIRAARAQSAATGAEIVLYPELVISGYPPEDLVLKPAFQIACRSAIESLAADTADGGPAMIVGTPWVDEGKLYNAACVLDAGRVQTVRYKHHLPNYGVFDEKRVFVPGPLPGPVALRGMRFGLMICEDMWFPDVAECLVESGAEILVVPNGSPFETDKTDQRQRLAIERMSETGLPLVYVNQVGGQDELVFDGASFAMNADGIVTAQMAAFAEAIAVVNIRRSNSGLVVENGQTVPPIGPLAAIYSALCLGLRDYVEKNRFKGVILGLSGGIDSALTAALAVDGLGADRVRAVMMPSRFTSRESLDDAAACAKLLGIRLDEISIEPAVAAFSEMLAAQFSGLKPDITEENIQSRCRGLTLMALSNKLGFMVVSTGNKSEMSAGYATLYGDMCGGFAVLKDVWKTTVFDLCRWRNAERPAGGLGPVGAVMPERVISKPPTAELREGQTDEASLGPYSQLDAILKELVESERTVDEIVAKGFAEADVKRIWRMLDLSEYKRRQAPPGVKITSRAFGRERRYPITNGFRG